MLWSKKALRSVFRGSARPLPKICPEICLSLDLWSYLLITSTGGNLILCSSRPFSWFQLPSFHDYVIFLVRDLVAKMVDFSPVWVVSFLTFNSFSIAIDSFTAVLLNLLLPKQYTVNLYVLISESLTSTPPAFSSMITTSLFFSIFTSFVLIASSKDTFPSSLNCTELTGLQSHLRHERRQKTMLKPMNKSANRSAYYRKASSDQDLLTALEDAEAEVGWRTYLWCEST
ncbi:uncharacterized protein BDR25DRAFT_360761 [Lindgomyces ingoldianus]|uniref:Uncharacterized protein n=1 Tax=Lindgomyces ingoldianus TaxID=673940 RepID=A0ACB6QG79_9PLEO|nr:uncharacterized protein BDR25DRAFT_360761 [Lindgomyces ingoldianus]KAF2465141.1 hypothetical protein BDR25DRAFT_360761 [Lindgomyces ingoldianus]